MVRVKNFIIEKVLSGKRIYIKRYKKTLSYIFMSFIFLQIFFSQFSLAEEKDKIYVDFFYNPACGSCREFYPVAEAIESNASYADEIILTWKDVSIKNYSEEYNYYRKNYKVAYPFFVVRNQTNTTIVKESDNVTALKTLEDVIKSYIAGKHVEDRAKDIVTINFLSFHLEINTTSLSLPILTIVLAGADSFNPCAFFILIFLLNLLIYSGTRSRMILVGAIFIFFSGFLYFLFMFVLLETITLFQISIISIVIGLITLILGSLNIKDFFFFKKGASVSIPESKRSEIFKRMRNIVKTPQILTAIIGTIILAATVNFYELLCTMGLPLVYVNRLATCNLSTFEYFMYIAFYNIIYVIPLVVILLIFVITLGRRKLSEWQGRILKLFSGIMLASFGIIFLIDYKILENLVTPILLLILALLATLVISKLWKKFHKKDIEDTQLFREEKK